MILVLQFYLRINPVEINLDISISKDLAVKWFFFFFFLSNRIVMRVLLDFRINYGL